jgi:hypothetical protein
MATRCIVSRADQIHAFPATKLGAFLRAMEDPEGTGHIDAARADEIARIEQRVAEAARGETERSSDDE